MHFPRLALTLARRPGRQIRTGAPPRAVPGPSDIVDGAHASGPRGHRRRLPVRAAAWHRVVHAACVANDLCCACCSCERGRVCWNARALVVQWRDSPSPAAVTMACTRFGRSPWTRSGACGGRSGARALSRRTSLSTKSARAYAAYAFSHSHSAYRCALDICVFRCALDVRVFRCALDICVFQCALDICVFQCALDICVFQCALDICVFQCALDTCVFQCALDICVFQCALDICVFRCALDICVFRCAGTRPWSSIGFPRGAWGRGHGNAYPVWSRATWLIGALVGQV